MKALVLNENLCDKMKIFGFNQGGVAAGLLLALGVFYKKGKAFIVETDKNKTLTDRS